MRKPLRDVHDLQAAFTLDHPDFACTPSVADHGDDRVAITGTITAADGTVAGWFARRLVRRGGTWIALHESFAVEPAFRRRGIAFSHYRKALRAYRRMGCHRVELYAHDHGTFVWPQFGFRYRSPKDHRDVAAALDRLHCLATGRELPFIPRREWEMIVVNTPAHREIGAEAAYAVADRHPSRAVQMVLDLKDRATLAFLTDRGIFDAAARA